MLWYCCGCYSLALKWNDRVRQGRTANCCGCYSLILWWKIRVRNKRTANWRRCYSLILCNLAAIDNCAPATTCDCGAMALWAWCTEVLLEILCEYKLRIVSESESVVSFILFPEMLLQICCEDELTNVWGRLLLWTDETLLLLLAAAYIYIYVIFNNQHIQGTLTNHQHYKQKAPTS